MTALCALELLAVADAAPRSPPAWAETKQEQFLGVRRNPWYCAFCQPMSRRRRQMSMIDEPSPGAEARALAQDRRRKASGGGRPFSASSFPARPIMRSRSRSGRAGLPSAASSTAPSASGPTRPGATSACRSRASRKCACTQTTTLSGATCGRQVPYLALVPSSSAITASTRECFLFGRRVIRPNSRAIGHDGKGSAWRSARVADFGA